MTKHTEKRVITLSIDVISFRNNYNIYVLEIRNQKRPIAAQTISVDFNFYPTRIVTNHPEYKAYALVSTNRHIV